MQTRSEHCAQARGRSARSRAASLACIGFAALVALPLGGSSVVRAAPDPEGSTTFDEAWPLAADGASVELSGLTPITEFTVEIPPGWAASADGELVLDTSVPELVESAAVGVSLNGEFVDAVGLSTPSGTTTISLPAGGFLTGTNTVSVEATIDIVDDRECPDPWHPARVVTFGPDSRIGVPLVPVGPLLLDDLPGALEPLGRGERVVTVRLTSSPTNEDLSAAAAVLAALHSRTDIEFGVVVERLTSRVRAAGPEIVIGVAADLTAAGFDVPATPGGNLSIGRNGSSHPRLVVSGSTPADVLAAAREVAAAPAVPVAVGIEPGTAPTPDEPSKRFTLADLGYPDRSLRGPGVRSTVYGFDAPLAVAPNSITLTIDAVRSASGDEVAGVSVFVNGSRVGTVHFDVDTGTTSGVQLNVSGEDVRPGRNYLRIDAEFPGPTHDCERRPPEESVEISASTSIELVASEESVAVDLEDLPYLLRAPNDSDDLIVVLQEDPSDRDIADAIDLAVTYGHDGFPAGVAHAGTLDAESLVGHHLIVLGDPAEQPLHELLPDSIVATQAAAAGSQQAAIETARLSGVIEVVPNPVDPTRLVLLATGFDAAGADLAQRVLLDRQLRGELYGRATFVGGTEVDPLLAPVLEPVRIERAGIATEDTGDATEDPTTVTTERTVIATVDDGTLFEADPPPDRSELGSIPLGLVGVAGAAALAGFGVLALHRRRKERTVAPAH